MTFYELMLERRRIGQKFFNMNGVANAADEARAFNKVLRAIAPTLCRFDDSVVWSLSVAKQKYRLDSNDFGRRVMKPMRMLVNGQNLTDERGDARLVSFQEIERNYPKYRNGGVAAGTPRMCAWAGAREVTIERLPSLSVVEAGENYCAGLIYPGALLASGQYLADGFPTMTVSSATDASTGQIDKTSTTIAAVGTSTVANAGNAAASDAAVATLTETIGVSLVSTDATFDDSLPYITFSNFAFGVPAGATVTAVRLKTLEATVTAAWWPRITWVKDVTAPVSYASQAGPVAGPWIDVTGLTADEVNDANFGFVLQFTKDDSGTPTLVPASPQMLLDYYVVEVDYTVPGSPGVPVGVTVEQLNTSEPDLDLELQDGLPYFAAVLMAEPGISTQDAFARVARFDQRWANALKDAGARNRRAITPSEDPGGLRDDEWTWGR